MEVGDLQSLDATTTTPLAEFLSFQIKNCELEKQGSYCATKM